MTLSAPITRNPGLQSGPINRERLGTVRPHLVGQLPKLSRASRSEDDSREVRESLIAVALPIPELEIYDCYRWRRTSP
jgi:hypothetical protein